MNPVSPNTSVLFVLIGWARNYDGTENVVGDHEYLKSKPRRSGEMKAFVRQEDSLFRCGAGRGNIHENDVDVVFVARHPSTKKYEIVAAYLHCIWSVDKKHNWCTVETTDTILFPSGKRPKISNWPTGQLMRRWARRVFSKGVVHKHLLAAYTAALKNANGVHDTQDIEVDPELSAFEGEMRKIFISHKKREIRLRTAKIRQALEENYGRLICEVPNCGFDFLKTYGEQGRDFAVVHHTRPLSSAPKGGMENSMRDLAIVCANCHAMIHRGGGCKDMGSLIP